MGFAIRHEHSPFQWYATARDDQSRTTAGEHTPDIVAYLSRIANRYAAADDQFDNE